LTPGIIYVLVAGLTGSVLTRTRSFPVRFLAPPVFALAALPYFLPKTAHNLRNYVSEIEDKQAPEFAAKHDAFNQNLEMHWHMAIDRIRGVSHEAAQWSSKAAEGVESATGLRVGDALRRSQAAAAKLGETRAVLREEVAALPDAPALTPPAPVTAPVAVEKVATVVEQKPIAEIVVAVPAAEAPKEAPTVEVPVAAAPAAVVPEAKPAPAKPADSGKRLV
jgi:organizing structure protein 2